MGDEELAPAGVLPRVRHRERAGLVLVRVAGGLALDLPAGPAGADAGIAGLLRERIAALDDEVLDHAMETGAVIELAVGELLEVGNGIGSGVIVQFGDDGAAGSVESGSLHVLKQ